MLIRKNSPKEIFATRNANFSCSLGCSNDENGFELFSKVESIEWKPESRHSWRQWSFQGIGRRDWESTFNWTGSCFREHGAASFFFVDVDVLAVHPPPSIAEIAVELFGTEYVSNDNDDAIETEDELAYCPNKNELLQIIKAKQKLFLFSKDGGLAQCDANHVVHIIDQHFAEKSRQTTIRDYYQSL